MKVKNMSAVPREFSMIKNHTKPNPDSFFHMRLGDLWFEGNPKSPEIPPEPHKLTNKFFRAESLDYDAAVSISLYSEFNWSIPIRSKPGLETSEVAAQLTLRQALWYMEPNDTVEVTKPAPDYYRVASKKFLVIDGEGYVRVEVTFDDQPPPFV